jgi:hypothetical protein
MHNQNEAKKADRRKIYFLRNEQPSVKRALPPVGWQRTVEHPAQMTTVCAWEKTVVMVKQPGHLTSMKKDLGAGTRFYRWQESTFMSQFICDHSGLRSEFVMRTLSLCWRASAAGVGLRRSTARTYPGSISLAYIISKFPYSTIDPNSRIHLFHHLNGPAYAFLTKSHHFWLVSALVLSRSCARFPFHAAWGNLIEGGLGGSLPS